MRVILQEKLAHLGDVGDEVTVKRGFGRNYLLPQDKAVLATPDNKAIFEKRRIALKKVAVTQLAEAEERAKRLERFTVRIETQVGEEGKLFGSIGPRDVAEAIIQAGQDVVKSEVNMPEGPIRQVGEYEIDITLHSEVHATVTVEVVATTAE